MHYCSGRKRIGHKWSWHERRGRQAARVLQNTGCTPRAASRGCLRYPKGKVDSHPADRSVALAGNNGLRSLSTVIVRATDVLACKLGASKRICTKASGLAAFFAYTTLQSDRWLHCIIV